MIDKTITKDMPHEEATLLHIIDSAMSTINKEIGKKELELECSSAAATLALFNALRKAEFKEEDKKDGYKVSRGNLYTLTKEMLGEKNTDSLINWFQKKHGYNMDTGYISFPVKHFREAGEAQARKEEKEKTAEEISAQIINDTETSINRGVTVAQLNYVYDLLEKFGIGYDTCVKGTNTLAYNMCKNFAKEISSYSMKNQEGVINKEELASKVATENMYNGMRETMTSIKKIFDEEKDKEKAAERVKKEIDFDERFQAEVEHDKREKDVSTIINYFLRDRIFKEENKEGGIELIIDDNKFREVFGFAERRMYLDEEASNMAAIPAVQIPAVQETSAKVKQEKNKFSLKRYYIPLAIGVFAATYGLCQTKPVKEKLDSVANFIEYGIKEKGLHDFAEGIKEDKQNLKDGCEAILKDAVDYINRKANGDKK